MTAGASPTLTRGHVKKLTLLDLARALAAFWVLGAHLGIMLGWRVYPWSEGRIPVDVFIFLSGFLMLHLLWPHSQTLGWRSVSGFYLRRFFRIAPCFYVAVFLYVFLRGFYFDNLVRAENYLGTPGSISSYVSAVDKLDIFAHLSFLHGFSQGRNTRVFGPAWTLSLEMQFYAIAPALVYLMRRGPVLTLLAAFACNAAAWFWFGVYDHVGFGGHHFFPSFLPDRLFLFCFGSAACLYWTEPTVRNRWLLAACGLGSILLFPLDSMILCLLLVVALLLILHAPEGPIRFLQRFSSTRLVGWGAELSYSVYLLHQFCFAVAAWLLQTWLTHGAASGEGRGLLAVVVVGCTVLLAAAMFYLIERPTREWGKHLSSRWVPLSRSSDAASPSAKSVSPIT